MGLKRISDWSSGSLPALRVSIRNSILGWVQCDPDVSENRLLTSFPYRSTSLLFAVSSAADAPQLNSFNIT